MENLEKFWNFKSYFQTWKNPNHKGFGKVLEMCYIHMFIYAELKKNVLKKEAQNISRHTL